NLEIESLRHVAPTFHGDTVYGQTTVLDKWPSKSKNDRGIVYVETKGYKQDGTLVCVFRRKVMCRRRRTSRSAAASSPAARNSGSRRSRPWPVSPRPPV